MCQCPVPWRGVYKAKPLRCGGWSACGWGRGFQPRGTRRACSTGHQSQGVQSRPWWLPRNKRTSNNNKKGPGHKAGPRACAKAASGRQWPREPGPGSGGRWRPGKQGKRKQGRGGHRHGAHRGPPRAHVRGLELWLRSDAAPAWAPTPAAPPRPLVRPALRPALRQVRARALALREPLSIAHSWERSSASPGALQRQAFGGFVSQVQECPMSGSDPLLLDKELWVWGSLPTHSLRGVHGEMVSLRGCGQPRLPNMYQWLSHFLGWFLFVS